MRLSASQLAGVEQLRRAATSRRTYYPSTLIIGTPGSGKRTIAREAAQQLGMAFVEVVASDAATYVGNRLFGTGEEGAQPSSAGAGAGELSREEPCLLYLSRLEGVDPEFLQVLHKIVTARTYIDGTGRRRSVSEDVWLVAGVGIPRREAESTIGPDHWVCRAFERSVVVECPTETEDVLAICKSMLEELGHDGTIGDDAKPLLAAVGRAPEGLRDLRRWLEGAVHRAGPDRDLSAALLQQGMVADVRWLLARVPYRGQELSVGEFERWLAQFPIELRALATHLLHEIAQRYYIGVRQFHEALGILISRSGIPAGSPVTFCRWQEMGKSAPRVTHAIRNQARWKPQGNDIDLEERPDRWPRGSPEPRWFVLADDFVGSGKTLSSLVSGPHAPLAELLGRYPRSQVRVLIVAGFERGLRRIAAAMRRYGDRVRLVPCYLFEEADRCFSPQSRIFPNVTHRESFREFCLRAAERHFPSLPDDWRLGFRGVGGLAVFYDSVPNNSLPLLWHDRGTWFPLFPASGMLEV